MKKIFIKNQNSFTLLEVLVYTGLIGILLAALMNLVFGIFFNYQQGLAQEELNYNANFLLAKISREVRRAKNIILPETTGEVLSLEMFLSSENPTSFRLKGKKVVLTRGTGGEIALTTDAVEVKNLVFTRVANGDSLSLRIEFTLGPAQGGISKTFKTSVTLRK